MSSTLASATRLLVALATAATAADRVRAVEAQAPTPFMEFVRIEPGTFLMGCSKGDTLCDGDEHPAHQVRLTRAFEIGTPTTTSASGASGNGSRAPSRCGARKRAY